MPMWYRRFRRIIPALAALDADELARSGQYAEAQLRQAVGNIRLRYCSVHQRIVRLRVDLVQHIADVEVG